ncbi:MAG: Recombination protein RecR [Bacteroidetes bacterium ADurb.Bin217]|nr:MAG: Recombination protein RecR [Bacteroidetes bacterium ADurb.Bin217]
MNQYEYPSKILEQAVLEIAKLPSIGKKTALRLALHILKQDVEYAQKLSDAIIHLKQSIQFCRECHTISDTELCDICANPKRDTSVVCVVESIKDVFVIEQTHQFKGVYHVLGGVISPIDGVSPQDLTIESLLERITTHAMKEIIFALPVTIEGDTTCFYIYKKIQDKPIVVTMLARGVAVGNELEYTDEATLARSIKDRVAYSGSK